MIKKIKKVSLSSLDKKLWKIFSEYIRKRDRKEGEYCFCVSCGAARHWKGMDAGHFIPRQHQGVKYDERNVAAQCKPCNGFEGGAQYKYGLALRKMYGDGIIKELEIKKRLNKNMLTRLWYLGAIEHYKEKLKEME